MSPSLLDFLNHILYECDYISRVISGKTREDVLEDETLIKAIVRSLEIIGEATKKLPADLRNRYPLERDALVCILFIIGKDYIVSLIEERRGN